MIKAFFKLIDKKLLILFIFALLASPVLCGKNTFSYCLIYSHYPTIYLNNIFLLFIYQYTYHLQQLFYPLIIRIQQNTFYLSSYCMIISLCFIYNIIFYISYYLFFGLPTTNEFAFVIGYMFIHMVISGLECSIVYLQLGQKKNFIYLAIPMIMNILFHFTWIQHF